jgi:superfamily II DNA/RNA helicase
MLDMGFEPQISQISQIILKSYIPPPEKRQTLLFSATFPRQLENLCQKFLHKTTKIEIEFQNPPSLIKQQFTFVPEESKRKALLDCINTANV